MEKKFPAWGGIFDLADKQRELTLLEKKMEVLDVDETPAYGLETKLKIGINGVVEFK